MSNTDPIGTLGARPPVSDLEHALAGGDGFAERMKQLATAKADSETALQNLNLGKSVKAAHAEVQQTVATAVSESNVLRVRAEATLDAAKARAASVISEANASAARIITDARANAASVKKDAAKSKQDAETYAAQKKTETDAAHATALENQQAAEILKKEAEAVITNHKAASASVQAAKAATEQTRAKLQAHIDKLHGVLREITE
jgi:hypothetical protein